MLFIVSGEGTGYAGVPPAPLLNFYWNSGYLWVCKNSVFITFPSFNASNKELVEKSKINASHHDLPAPPQVKMYLTVMAYMSHGQPIHSSVLFKEE